MLLKLMKYEFKSSGRKFLILYLAIIALAILVRLLGGNESSNDSTVFGIVVIAYVIAIYTSIIYMIVTIISSYNKQFFGRNGYLTLTLPVDTKILLLARLLMAVIWALILMLIIGISVFAFIPNFSDAVGDLGKFIADYGFNSSLWSLILITILSLFQNIMVVFMVCTFIHTKWVKSHRGLIGFGSYIIVTIVLEKIQELFFPTMESSNTTIVAISNMKNYLNESVLPASIFAVIVITFAFIASVKLIENKIEID